jgi:hypothetical protein
MIGKGIQSRQMGNPSCAAGGFVESHNGDLGIRKDHLGIETMVEFFRQPARMRRVVRRNLSLLDGEMYRCTMGMTSFTSPTA